MKKNTRKNRRLQIRFKYLIHQEGAIKKFFQGESEEQEEKGKDLSSQAFNHEITFR